ncbi:MAG: hypothetical protein Q3M30_03590 [Candidatus Electrothrix sp. Rat3]|nr:hypothetical protein [Candidatus Electrothrix rattekaaiensis]
MELDGLKLVSFKPLEREENLKEEKSGKTENGRWKKDDLNSIPF